MAPKGHRPGSSSMFAQTTEPIPLPARFARIKKDLIEGKQDQIKASWTRLLVKLRAEIDLIDKTGPDIYPSVDFDDLKNPSVTNAFASGLKDRGVAVVRKVIPHDLATQWKTETEAHLEHPRARRLPTHDPHLYGVYWSPGQIKARAHENIIYTQRFLMNLWHSSDPKALVSPNFPVSYADRMRIRNPGDEACSLSVYVDGGSVERWEPDGYGSAATYQPIFDGHWEDWEPWESSTRLKVTSDLYNGDGSCSMFRMLQGWVALSDVPFGQGTLLLCPMIRLTTAYLLLRPFFIPKDPSLSGLDFLSPDNWILEEPPSSVIQGALPSYPQELNDALHPHLQLNRSMIPIPKLEPGDYLVWHPDAVYALDRRHRLNTPPTTIVYLPACPLTQTNALYLAHQRKGFLQGEPGPDFTGALTGDITIGGEQAVREVGEAGGVDGMRAMGILPWDEDEAQDDIEYAVLEMANGVLFPERYDAVY
ncbi:hypothetical protein NW752_012175 [Fusarium irregulare]|uniref:DUF1479 domain protein n=1 Tax=Fusarium irregulare TaxID=2494466 RepID=A0A9W8PFH2_9HYPO|nr:hypothetical protein NW752_012175 [Fusarium irregulare]KAJ4004369.1 hypothetical protein NW766_011674 [Fusarium irregulare]